METVICTVPPFLMQSCSSNNNPKPSLFLTLALSKALHSLFQTDLHHQATKCKSKEILYKWQCIRGFNKQKSAIPLNACSLETSNAPNCPKKPIQCLKLHSDKTNWKRQCVQSLKNATSNLISSNEI